MGRYYDEATGNPTDAAITLASEAELTPRARELARLERQRDRLAEALRDVLGCHDGEDLADMRTFYDALLREVGDE